LLNPRDPAEAQLAAVGNFIHATQPGVSNDIATRLRGNALNASRTCAAMRARLPRRHRRLAAPAETRYRCSTWSPHGRLAAFT
jgi:hypothetical protein